MPSVSVQNGSKIVTVNNTQTTNIKVGDALLIGNYQPVEIAGVFATQLSLRTNWSNAAQANASAVVLPTFGDFNAATQALRQATQVTQGNFKTLEDWGTKLGNITFEGQDNSKHTARTLLQMDADVSELEEQANNLIVSLSGLNFALSKAIVDALRSGNKEQYAASGFIHYGKHFNSGNLSSVNEGMTVDIGTPNVIYLGARDGVTGGNVGGASKTSYPVMNVAGFEVHLLGINSTLTNWQASTIKLPVEPDGTTTYNKSTGAVVKHSDSATAFAVAEADSTGNTEVVINRVDMAGLEFFKRKVGEYLYPYGSPQCGYTEVDGIPTTEDTSRPITYFAAYDGDTTSRGRGWRLVDLTFAQLAVIMSNPKHNAWYNEEGELLQFGPRQRSFAGIGNGDWGNTNPSELGLLAYSQSSPVLRVIPQGDLDTGVPLGAASFYYYGDHSTNAMPETGAFSASTTGGKPATSAAVDGESYFYVLATVPRLNTAAYNNANFMGSCKFSDNKFWHNSAVPRVTIDDAFSNASTDKSASGREDGKKAQFIYQSGQGGVIDWRLPARDMGGKEEANKVFQKVVNGSYLGIEKLVESKVMFANRSGVADFHPSYGLRINMALGLLPAGLKIPDVTRSKMYCHDTDTYFTVRQYFGAESGNDRIYVADEAGNKHTAMPEGILGAQMWSFIKAELTNISVSGNFTTLDVVAPPERVMATPDLANGWMGRLCPIIPDNTGKTFPASKKYLTVLGREFTTDGGSTWQRVPDWTGQGANVTLNAIATTALPPDRVTLNHYTAFAKQTKRSTNKPVLNSSEGVGDVWNSADSRTDGGVLLGESMLGKVFTNTLWVASQNVIGLASIKLVGDKLSPSGSFLKHGPLELSAPENSSPAVKALWHQASNNQQATLNFLWNEMVLGAPNFTVVSDENYNTWTSGTYYEIRVGWFRGFYLCTSNSNLPVNWQQWVSDSAGDVYASTNGLRYFRKLLSVHGGSGWGDDKTIRIVDGQSTYINLNGDTCLYGTDELAMPYGYTKNQAGAGKQVVGVDL
ncbi:hypothetical protein QNE35_004036 [Vibrio vulnificus]|nr:hypothetical protein [Vibrio vulnificus]